MGYLLFTILHLLHIPLLILPRHFSSFHLPSQILRPRAHILRRQERQARATLFQQIARATVEHRLGRVDARLGHARHTVTERARAAQIQAIELGTRRECPWPHLLWRFFDAV